MNLTDDLTNGIIWKQLTALALPLIWGNILQQMYNTIDSFVVGHYIGETAFAAAGVAGSVMNLSLFVISGCCNGIAIIIAELYGQKNWDLLRKESFLSLAFGGGFTIMLSMCGMLALQPLLRGIQTPAEVAGFIQEYLRIIYLGLPAVFLYNWCAAVLRGAGDTGASLWILLLAMGLNTILDFLFVLSFGLGMAGTAYATVVSQLFAAFICLGYMKKQTPKLLFHARDVSFHFPLFMRTIMLGTISALHQSSLYIGKLLVQGAVNTGGTGMISAYTATARIEGFANSFGDSGCTAISIFTAQNRGAHKRVRIRQGFLCGLRMMAGLGLVLSITMFLTSGPAVILLMGGGIWSGFKPCQVLYERDIRLLCPLLPWQFLCGLLSRAWHGTDSGLWYHPAYFDPRNSVLCVDQALGAGGGCFCYRSRMGSGGAVPVDTVPESYHRAGSLTIRCTVFASSSQTSSLLDSEMMRKEESSFIP